MGSPKTRTVGGGAASPVANSWNNFLQGQLYQQPGGQSIPQAAAGTSQPPAGMGRSATRAWAMNQARNPQATSQSAMGTPGPFQDILNSFMNPNYGNMVANNPFLAGAQGYNPMANMPGVNMPGQPNVPNIAGSYNPSQSATMDPMSFLSNFGSGTDLLSQYGINLGDFLKAGQPTPVELTSGQLKDYSTDPSFQAIQDIANRQSMKDIADLRARYGLMGNTQSSGASLAESQYRAEANPRLIASLGGLGREVQGLDLELQKMINASRIAANNTAANTATSMSGDVSRNLGNILQYIQGNRGQDIGAASGLAGQNLANIQGTNNLNANNFLQALGMDASNLINLFGQNSSNALNMFGQQSSNALNNQNMANNWMQTLFGGGLNLAGLGQQGQMGMLNNLFNSFNQSNQLGTPQAQTVQTPSPLSQGLGLVSSILPFIPGMQPLAFGASMLNSGMSRPMAPPQVQGLGQNYTPNFGIGNYRPYP